MRQGQQNNKRMRGRNRGGKGPNPLTRSYESNGGDVKIRGTALHVAEKYVQLARDAQSSGDRVAGENYLQHAEHYYRIVAAAQAQMPQPQSIYRGDEDGDDDDGQPRQDGRPQHFNHQGGFRPQGQGGQYGGGPGGDSQQPYVNGGGNGGGQQPAPQSTEQQYTEQQPASDDGPDGERAESFEARPDRGPGGGNARGRRRRPYRDQYGDRGGERSPAAEGGEPQAEQVGEE